LLGEIKWFGRWKQYSFFPESDTVWNRECLDDINRFISQLMLERQLKRNPKLIKKLMKQPKSYIKETWNKKR